jgi:hypothetical protein
MNRVKVSQVLCQSTLYAVLLACMPLTARAEWTFFSSLDGDTVLIDRTTLVQNKNRNSTIWMLTNFGTPTAQDVLSVSKWVEFDCDRNKYRYLAVYGYEGQMQTGAKLINIRTPSLWDKTKYGTVLKNLQLVACLRGPLLR